MTIYTSNSGEKKDADDVKGPMVYAEDVPDLEFKKKTLEDEDVLLPPQPAAIIIAQRRRHRTLFQFCLMLCAIFVLALGVMTGIYLYKHFTRPYIGVCGVRASDYEHHTFEFEQVIETDERQYEKIQVPAINDFREAKILHDFDRSYTAIVDVLSDRCFVMPLNYSLVKPPKDFWDLISKLESGYYLPDEEMVRENYQVLEPAVNDLTPFGFYIWSECRDLTTYRMQRINDQPVAMVKRSAQLPWMFVEGTGKRIIGYNIFGNLINESK